MKKKHIIIGITLICIAVVILITIIFVLPAVEKSNLQDINDNLDFYGIKLMMSEEELLKNEYVDKEPEYLMESNNDAMSYRVNNLENGKKIKGGRVDYITTAIINNERVVTHIMMQAFDSKCNIYGIRPDSSIEEAKTTLKEKGFIEKSQDIDETGYGDIIYHKGYLCMDVAFSGDGTISYLRIWYQ